MVNLAATFCSIRCCNMLVMLLVYCMSKQTTCLVGQCAGVLQCALTYLMWIIMLATFVEQISQLPRWDVIVSDHMLAFSLFLWSMILAGGLSLYLLLCWTWFRLRFLSGMLMSWWSCFSQRFKFPRSERPSDRPKSFTNRTKRVSDSLWKQAMKIPH